MLMPQLLRTVCILLLATVLASGCSTISTQAPGRQEAGATELVLLHKQLVELLEVSDACLPEFLQNAAKRRIFEGVEKPSKYLLKFLGLHLNVLELVEEL